MTKFLLVFCVLLLFVSCADSVDVSTCVNEADQPGFWYGLLHGMIAPFSFLVSLFDDSVSVYAINNSGGWYDFGFLLGIGAFSSSSSSISKK